MAAAALVPLLLATPSAFGASLKERARAARKACLAGAADKGAEILAELFVETKDPTYIFNQGRCFGQNRRYEDAVARFEEYLSTFQAQLSADDKAAAERHIADYREKLKKQRAESQLEPTPPIVVPAAPRVPEPSPQAAPSESTPMVVTRPAPEPVEGHRRWGLVTAGIITTAVGVGAAVTGLVFNLKANNTVNDMETKLGAYSNSKVDEQKKYKTLAWVGYGAGAACAVAGVIMIAIGASQSDPSSSSPVAFVPAVGPGQVGAMLRGGF